MDWTDEQLKVIAYRGGNLLVSAAAGSGKTAVLIERIMGRLLDETAPIGIDEFLVVTFTRDAAREMKERIGVAISRKLEEEVNKNPDSKTSVWLMKQSALLSQAQMSTIDSFCKRVVMENFKEAEIDPGVRTMDETEGIIIKKKVIEELLEAEYEKKDAEFINFVEYFVRGKSDKILEDLILQLYRFSESLPDKEKWFDTEISKMDEPFIGSEFESKIFEQCIQIIKELKKEAKSFIKITKSSEGPVQYEDTGNLDVELFSRLSEAKSFEELSEFIKNVGFVRLSTKKAANVDEGKKERAKSLRDAYKDEFNKLKEDFFAESIEEIEISKKVTDRVLKELIRLVREFDKAYADEKKKRNVADISDWAKIALKVLIDNDKPSLAAKAYREQFAEIMIDEYQDSNFLQEKILTSISREKDGESNLFMVGDVKQSIYKFRQAKPELFMEKLKKYAENEGGKRIDLNKNFRSSNEVIKAANAVFEKVMTEGLGGIAYDEKAELKKFRKNCPEDESNKTEILIFDKSVEVPKTQEKSDAETKKLLKQGEIELEAYMIAARIKVLMKDKSDKKLRYSDIAILLRTNVEWAESFRRILIAENIPAVCESGVGYFSAWEVQVMLSLLKILDNPRQDLPLGTVLLSPIGGFNEEELAKLRIRTGRDVDLWTALCMSDDEKAVNFLSWLDEKRAEMIFTPVHEFIRELCREKNFYNYVSAMPSGETRATNLDMLVEKARAYEATSLHGVVHFVRYINKLQKYEVDFGEAGTGVADAVRIMSIHKSKGLQYPVVFVCGMAKSMNNQDSRAGLIIHTDVGLGIDYFNIKTREKKSTLLKKMLARKLRLENVAEEIRLLYVAMTRAEDKLILTAGLEDVYNKLETWGNDEQNYLSLSKTNSLIDFTMPALLKEENKDKFTLIISSIKELLKVKIDEMAKKKVVEKDITKLIAALPEPDNYKEIKKIITDDKEYLYPFKEAVELKSKMTVSEIKRLHLEEEESGEVLQEIKSEKEAYFEPYIPEFMLEEPKEVKGAIRGTLYHLILKSLDFSKKYDETKFREYLSNIAFDKKITNEEAKSIDLKQFVKFFDSSLYKRMKQAFINEKLFRETPFVIGINKEIAGETEIVLVQGIIDAWFMEGDNVILMDYKTDRVFGKQGEEELIKRYKVQLDNYAEALRRITGKVPKEKIIYSFTLGKEILIED